jgi:hypothetical protein
MTVVDTNRGWRETWCNSERDRTNGKIALPATVSRSGLGQLDLDVSDCRLQPLAFAQVEAVQGGSAVRLAGLSGTNDVASLRRYRIGP